MFNNIRTIVEYAILPNRRELAGNEKVIACPYVKGAEGGHQRVSSPSPLI
jgi:hypothetical protein